MTSHDATPPDDEQPSPPPSDAANSRLRLITIIAISVVLALGTSTLIVVSAPGQSNDTDKSATPSPSESSPTKDEKSLPPFDKPSDNGKVDIVEQGYDTIKDVAGDDQVSWGAMVSNTSDEMAATVKLELEILDSDGESLNKDSGDYALDPVVAEVLPGEKTGTGNVVYVDGPDVDKVKLRVKSVEWWPKNNQQHEFADIKVSKLDTEWVNKGESTPYWGDDEMGSYVDERGDLKISFRADSDFKQLLTEPGAATIFRNDDGDIVGGAPADNMDFSAQLPPGWSEQFITVKYGPPPDTDESSIEVYAYSTNQH